MKNIIKSIWDFIDENQIASRKEYSEEEQDEIFKQIYIAKEVGDMFKLLASEFKLAKSEIRTNRNKDVQKMGNKLRAGECSQEEYNFFVNLCNKDTEYDENITKKADELISKL